MKKIFKNWTQANTILGVGSIILFVLCLYPFIVLISKIIFIDGEFTFKYFIKAFSNSATLRAIQNTVLVSLATSTLGVFLALPMSWLLTRTNLNNATRWRSLFCLPYAIPPYIVAIAWIYLANPSNGILNVLFGSSLVNVYTFSGLIWVMGSSLYAFILLSLLAALDRMDPSLEEAARLSGAGPFRVFKDITLPLITPALLSGILLVTLAAAASFGVPAMIGNPARIYLVTTRIYTFQKMGSLSGIYQSGALSTILLIMAVLALFINQWILKKAKYQTVGGKSARPSLIDLATYKKPINLFLIGLFFILFILPVGAILITALNKIQGQFSLTNLGLQNFTKLFTQIPEAPRAFFNSTVLAVSTAFFCCFIGMILSYIQWKTRIRGRNVIEIVASLPYSTPGTVLALAFILAFSSNFLGIPISLYNTLPLIGLAYAAKYLNFAIRTTGDGYRQIDDSLAEAARVSGASWLTTLRTIWFPLMKPSLVASFFLILMPAFSELTMTILLTGPGLETVGTVLFQLQEYADASGGASAVLALIIITAVAGVNFLVRKLSKGKYGL
jgi:iron(III) transport system permease protein